MQTITKEVAPGIFVPEIPAEQLETIPTRPPVLPADMVPRERQRTGEPSTFRGWTMGGRVD